MEKKINIAKESAEAKKTSIVHHWYSDKTCSTCSHYDSGKGICRLDSKSTSSGGYCSQWG